MYDCIIIGSGVAGVSAALTLKALKRSFLIIGNKNLSAKVMSAEKIKNYPGLNGASGAEFVKIMQAQLSEGGIALTEGRVTGIYDGENGFFVACGQDVYEGRTIILATGVETVRPIKGEKEFLGRGVSYCATCDGFLYKGKTIVVVCASKEEEHEVELLASYAAKVCLFALYKDCAVTAPNVEIMRGMPSEIVGGMKVEGVMVGGRKIEADGVFMLKDAACDSLYSALEVSGGAVRTGRDMSTNISGIFAAGDCTGRPYQYAKAAGEGNVAAHSVNARLNEKDKI